MSVEFLIENERVVITRYSEPIQASEVENVMIEVDAFAEQADQGILAIADFVEIKKFPAFILSMGLRRNDLNPVRNSKIATLLVIADSAALENIIGAVTRITRVKKIVMVRTREEAEEHIQAFLHKN